MRDGQVLKERYRLTQHIATGGMGEVWRAEDLTLHRTVAIKVLHPALAADPEFQQRFIQEARTLAKLNAPGLIDLYDTCEEPGESGAPLSYLVMELVEGRPLSEVLAADGRLDAATTMSILAQCGTALQAAHGAGIVHRDIKPANILIDADGTVTVIDFGIARTRGHSPLTAVGSVIGTVEYASPEQLQGETLTGASDVYSLGVVGYECLTGNPPFHEESSAGIITAHLHQEPPPLPPEIPPAVAGIITTALAKDPTQRFDSAADMARACRNFDAAAPLTRHMPVGRAGIPAGPTSHIDYEPPAPDEPAAESLEHVLRKRTVTTVAITLGLVLVIAAIVGLTWWAGSDAGGDPAQETSSSPEPSSPSPSPSPTGPDEPASSTLANAHTGKCVDVDFGFFTDSAVLADCGDSAKVEFVASASDKDIFEIVRDNDGEKVCLNWAYGTDDVVPGDCDFDAAWKFVWLETSGDVDVWQIQSVSNSNYCLAVGSERPQGQNCTEDANQQWHTKAVTPQEE